MPVIQSIRRRFPRHKLNAKFGSLVFLGIAAALALGGCGWHLQGSGRLPPAMLAIHIDTVDAYSDFYRELRAGLLAAGAQITTQASTASAVVHVKSDQTGQRLASVSARNRPEQYTVYYNVVYSVDVRGVEAIPDQSMELMANYSYDVKTVLAKQREQLSMQQALARDLAEQVLRRLTVVDTQSQVRTDDSQKID